MSTTAKEMANMKAAVVAHARKAPDDMDILCKFANLNVSDRKELKEYMESQL